MRAGGWTGAENYAKRRVAELLAEQIECADVVVLTKMELVPREQRDFMRALLRLLLPPNAGSLVVPVESGADPSPHLAERIWIDSDWERTVKQPPPPPPSPLSPDPTW